MLDVIKFVKLNPNCITSQIVRGLTGLGYSSKSVYALIENARRYGHINVTSLIRTYRREHTFA